MVLKHILACAWAEHLRETDKTLPFDQRIQIVDSCEVVNTFVHLVQKTIKVPSCDIYKMACCVISNDTIETPYSLMTLLLCCYTEHVLMILKELKHEKCYGCGCTEQYGPGGHPSQRHHECLEDSDILLGMYFTDCLNKLDEKAVMKTLTEKLNTIDEVVLPNSRLISAIKYELESSTTST